jgi:steroid 5-alpha reductase family enzyme
VGVTPPANWSRDMFFGINTVLVLLIVFGAMVVLFMLTIMKGEMLGIKAFWSFTGGCFATMLLAAVGFVLHVVFFSAPF